MTGPSVAESLADDRRGAVMVLGVFLAMLLVGFLYYLLGVGNTILYRERVQDAADAMAFNGAVMHARALNLIALINITLAMLMAVWIAMRVVQVAMIAALVVCGLAVGTCPVPVNELVAAEADLGRRIATYWGSVLRPALRLGHGASAAIRTQWPALANTAGWQRLRGMYTPPVRAATLVPTPMRPLPLRTVQLRRHCDHVGFRGRAPRAPEGIPLLARHYARVWPAVVPQLPRGIAADPCEENRGDLVHFEIEPGDGSCTDGLPGQNCEYAQVRAAVDTGGGDLAQYARGATMAHWGRGAGGSLFGAVGALGNVGFAQAEYYFEGVAGREIPLDEWLYHPRWRARLRRVRLSPLGGAVPGVQGVNLGQLDALFAH